jgi:hypothetical protein
MLLAVEIVVVPWGAGLGFTEPVWDCEMVRWLSTEATLWVGDEPGAVPMVETLDFRL